MTSLTKVGRGQGFCDDSIKPFIKKRDDGRREARIKTYAKLRDVIMDDPMVEPYRN